MSRPATDITGQRFGKWTVIRRAERPRFIASTAAYWECRCDCGNEGVINGTSLRNGGSKSCGCQHSEAMLKYHARKRGEA